MAARIGKEEHTHQKCIVNMTGTYGVASMQFYWGRIAGLVNRCLLHADLARWSLVYVDDWLPLFEILPREPLWEQLGVLRVFLIILGLPISWGKLAAGERLDWIGHFIDVETRRLSPTQSKITTCAKFLTNISEGELMGIDSLMKRSRFAEVRD